MKYCSNCGEPLNEEAVFCPICGTKAVQPEAAEAPTEAAEVREAPETEANAAPAAPKKRKKGGKIALIIALVAVGLAALLLIAGALLYFTGAYAKLLPASRLKLGLAEKEYVERALDDYFEKYNSSYGKASGLELKADVDITGDIELSDNASFFSEAAIINSMLEKAALKVKLDINSEHSNALFEASYSNNPIFDARIITAEDMIGFYAPLLDDKYYTASAQTLKDLFVEYLKDSGFEISEDIAEAPAGSLKVDKIDEAKVRTETMEMLKIVGKLSTKENTAIERGQTRNIAGKFDENGVLYTITPSLEEYESMLNELADYLAADGCYTAERANRLIRLLGMYDDAGLIDSDIETEDDISGLIRSHAHEIAENLAERHTKIEVFMVGNEILSQGFVFDDGKLVYDEVTRSNTEYKYLLADDIDSGTVKLMLENNISDKNKLMGRMTADFNVTDPIEFSGFKGGVFVLDYNFDKTKLSSVKTYPGTAVLSFQGGEVASLTITPVGDNMKHTLILDLEKLDSIAGDSEYAYDIEDLEISKVTLIALASEGTGVEAPAGVEPTDIAGYSADDIQEILYDMIQKLSDQLMRILY